MPRLIIDMDDVLANASKKILSVFNRINHTSYTEEYFEKVNFYEFLKTGNFLELKPHLEEKGFFRDLEVMPHAQIALEDLGKKYEIFIVSAAMEFPNSLADKYQWMQEHFPEISWKNIVFCGDKSLIMGDVMIDDHEKNLATFSGQKILFTAMHNHHIEGYTRLNSWAEFDSIL